MLGPYPYLYTAKSLSHKNGTGISLLTWNSFWMKKEDLVQKGVFYDWTNFTEVSNNTLTGTKSIRKGCENTSRGLKN